MIQKSFNGLLEFAAGNTSHDHRIQEMKVLLFVCPQ
jgi:hypothetical protein